jgi:hypothetical protein
MTPVCSSPDEHVYFLCLLVLIGFASFPVAASKNVVFVGVLVMYAGPSASEADALVLLK